jgi:serine/threonine protein kinase
MNLLSERYQLGEVVYGDAGVVVYRGHDQKLNRAVTIELPRADHPNEVVAETLRDKARRMALADLPYVAALYDQGEQDGRPYLVFEELIGTPLAEVAPLDPGNVVAMITAICGTLRAARQQQVDPPRLDPNSVRFGDGRPQIVDWGIAAATMSEIAALSSLLALAATGSKTGTTSRRVPASLLRVVQRAVGGEYASADDLERELRESATAADEPTVVLPRARPTVMMPERTSEPLPLSDPLPAPPRRNPLLFVSLGLLLVLLLAGGLWARGRSDTPEEVTVPETTAVPSQATAPAVEPAPTVAGTTGTPYTVATVDGRRLNVRAGPGQNFGVVGRLNNGSEVRVVEGPVTAGRFRWVRVEGNGVSGWCVFEALRPR